jgi:hypothetical protein
MGTPGLKSSEGLAEMLFSEGLERETGFEPATACLEGRYSTSLSYSRLMLLILAAGIETVKRNYSWTAKPGH